MFVQLCGRMWVEDPHEAKRKHEFFRIAAAYASYREGPGVLLSSKPTMSQECILVRNKVENLWATLGRVLPAGQGVKVIFVLYAALVRPLVENCVTLPGCVTLLQAP